ncbi:tape measure protein [Proteus mirabilis]|uniref:tape measure protein n=1 Tax=Proteus mirabilis TaxID=584 RepID=UPI000BB4EDDE|nr:tape measure protein [Proteus mirabilis]ATC75051.1 tape measure protein [Proteus mirabilis]ATC79783.1 tape measure protein [Proteus mirabilis]NHT79240.1 tape measure protein [Proteus mirabilis]NHU07743.1 tape measure protein [Proteus mirabilis]NHU12251.1 tape measure protein [Proteus mirabilis]
MAQVGEIVYQVQMDVRQLLASQQQLEQRLNRMDSSFNRTSQSVNNTERSMQSLSKVAAALTGYLSVSMVASYSEAWTELNNKLSNSVRASESLIDVTQRVFDISQATRSSLDATATLYARLERGTREYNTSAEDLAKLTSIINQGFIVSGATAQEAENAIIQLSQGIASGVLRGEEFNSVAEQGSRLMVALADSLGVSIGQLRKMAAEGKLTTDVVVKGLLSQGDAIGKEFAKTTRTMSQAFQEAGNNLTKFLGENTTIKASINVFSDAVITASKSLDEMVLAVSLVASVVGGRYIAAMGLAIKAKMQSAVAARQEAIANLQAARVAEHNAIMTARKTALDLAAARALVEKAKTEFAAARGTNAEATALANLIAVRSAATTAAINHKQATQAQTAAMANSAAAARAASVSIGLANKALGFVGGPAGIAMAAGAAIMYFYQQAKEAREEAVKLAEGVNQLTAEMKNMTREQKRAESAKLKEALPELKNEVLNTTVAMKQAAEKVRELEADLALAKVGTSKYESITKQLADAQDKLAIATDNATKASNNYSRTKNTISFIQADLNGELKEGIDLLKREISVLPSGAKGWDSYGFSIDRALQKKKEFNGEKISFEWSKEGMDLRKSLEREMKLANAKSEVDKRLLQVDFYIEDKGITDEREIYQLKQIAIATQKAQDAAAERNKTTKESTKATDAAYEALKRQREEIELLNKGYKDGSLEMAKYDAVKALGDTASPKQIEKAEQLAEEKYNIERNLADKKAALELDLVAKAKESHDKQLADLERITKDDVSLTEQAARRKAEIEAEYQQKIAEIKANNAVSPQDDIKGKVDPVQQLKNEHERKLALIREFETEKGAITQRGLELMNAANTQYEQARTDAMYELWRNQSLGNEAAAAALDAFSGSASNALTGIITGSMEASDALRSIGNTVLNSLINTFVQAGIEQAKAAWFGAAAQQSAIAATTAVQTAAIGTQTAVSTAAAATTTAAWTPAAIMASIASMGTAAKIGLAAIAVLGVGAIAGARKNGGPVDAGSMYRVGEGGKPEIFKANNGRQYMIPGDNGKVISNKDMQGGGMNVNVVFNDYSSGGHKFDAQASQDGNTLTIQAFIMDMDNKGPMLQSITRNTSATARARG